MIQDFGGDNQNVMQPYEIFQTGWLLTVTIIRHLQPVAIAVAENQTYFVCLRSLADYS